MRLSLNNILHAIGGTITIFTCFTLMFFISDEQVRGQDQHVLKRQREFFGADIFSVKYYLINLY